ncbi:MAG: Type II secretion system protein D precursor [candidate division BRC1 bacterium ADurb.BinA364]|nr:MAG: Type II secretion system protein D precursor [candidate division BRC1 bacterium ADurb.BinA364]
MRNALRKMAILAIAILAGAEAAAQPSPFLAQMIGRGGTSGRGGSSSSETGIEGYIVADQDTNSLIVMADEESYAKIKNIVDFLDRPMPQALIKVLVAEVTHSNDLDIGAELRYLHDSSTNTDTGVPKELDYGGTNFNLASETTGMMVRVLEHDLDMTLRALQEVAKLEVLSRPSILAVNNQPANITVGNEVPFIRNSRVTNDGQTINTIEYEDIGIILDVTPHINDSGLIIMDVAPEISTLTGDTVPISETVNAPVIAKRSASSRVVAPDGKTIVIGGLMEDQDIMTERKVPILGDIPIIKYLFRRKITSTAKTELLIFLTPQIVKEFRGASELAKEEGDKAPLIKNSFGGQGFSKYIQDLE